MAGSYVLQANQIDYVIRSWLGVDERGLRPFTHATLTKFLVSYCRLTYGHPGVTKIEGQTKQQRFEAAISSAGPSAQVRILKQLMLWEQHPSGNGRNRSLDSHVRRMAERLERANKPESVTISHSAVPQFAQTALDEARKHANSSKHQLATDRVHAAIHDCAKALLEEVDIPPPEKFQEAFSKLRKQHPAFQVKTGDRPSGDIFQGLGKILDGLNAARNKNSLSHPTAELLDAPEAKLAYNAGMSALEYILDKVKSDSSK